MTLGHPLGHPSMDVVAPLLIWNRAILLVGPDVCLSLFLSLPFFQAQI